MRSEMRGFFAAQRKQAATFVLLGLGACLIAARLWQLDHPRGAVGFPLVALGLAQLAAGGVVLLRTPRRARDLSLRLVQDPAAFRAEELARMGKAMADLALVRLVVISVALAGGALMATSRWLPAPAFDVGLGLLVEGTLMLVAAMLAGTRGRRYVRQLGAFLDPHAPVAGERDYGE